MKLSLLLHRKRILFMALFTALLSAISMVTDVYAQATTGACGYYNHTALSQSPLTGYSTGVCASGTPGFLTGGDLGPWTWSCTGTTGAPAQCSAVTNGHCGYLDTAHLSAPPSPTDPQLCWHGTPTTITTNADGSWTWSCYGGPAANDGTTSVCTATPMPTSGACGTANNSSLTAAPTAGAECSTGTASAVTTTANGYSWSCAGLYGGATALCTATHMVPSAGVCGSANDSVVSSSPSSNLCATGSASAVTGSGPWNWTCSGVLGGATTSCSALPPSVTGPTVPKKSQAGDIVGVIIQNTGANTSAARYTTFGQPFVSGDVQPTDFLAARNLASGQVTQVQMDALSLWPDGSVKFAAITMAVAALPAGGSASFMLEKGPACRGFSHTPLAMATIPLALDAQLVMTAPATQTFNIDLKAALLQSLQNTPDYWLNGPLAVQARVDVPVTATLHVTGDVTLYRDGSIFADVQFNNDIGSVLTGNTPPGPVLAPLSYTANLTLNGQTSSYPIEAQYQYQDWHARLASNGASSLNIQHDVGYIKQTGGILNYDLTTGVSSTTLQSYANKMQNYTDQYLQGIAFGAPLADNTVMRSMGTTGGRPDIGYTTQYNTAWLMLQDPRTAAISIAQGDTAGAVPWNFKLANGHWETPHDNPDVWFNPGAGGSSGDHSPANNMPTPSSSSVIDNSGWEPDIAHQPNLSYIPYMMTASRWNLDRLNAQAAYNLLQWVAEMDVDGYNDIVIGRHTQTRGAAWSLREIIEAAWIGKTGSWEQQYFQQVEQDNLNWAITQETALATGHGATTGEWFDYGYYDVCNSPSNTSCSTSNASNYDTWLGTPGWMNDYLTGVFIMAARMGSSQATQILGWQRNWIVGRFTGSGMNPSDGCGYIIPSIKTPATYAGLQSVLAGTTAPSYLQNWSDIEAALVTSGLTEGSSWTTSDYCQISRAMLGGFLSVYPNDSGALSAYNILINAGNTGSSAALSTSAEQYDPTWNVVKP